MADKQLEKLSSTLTRLETCLDRIEKKLGGASNAAPSTSSGAEKPFVGAFDQLVQTHIKPYIEISKKFGGDIEQHAALVEKAIKAQRDLLVFASSNKKPANLQNALGPLSQAMGAVKEFKDKNNRTKNPSHLSAVAEGISALGWVAEALPVPFVGEMKGSSEFWTNRILKDFKGKDQQQVDWVMNFNNFLKELQVYVKQYHTTGLVWAS